MNDGISSWLRCYRCWSRNLEVQIHYDALRKVDPETRSNAGPLLKAAEAILGNLSGDD